MINIYITHDNYENNKNNINFLLQNYEYIKIIFIENENDMYKYIVTNNLLYNNNILVDEISENLLKRLVSINYCNNSYLLNIKLLNNNDNLSYIDTYKINILDFNNNNIDKTKKYKNMFLQLYNEIEDIMGRLNIIKINNVAILGKENEIKNNMYKKCVMNMDKVDIEKNGEKYDINRILSYKIIVFDDEPENDIIISCIINKVILIHYKTNNKCINPLIYKYSIDANENITPMFLLFIIKNYQQVTSILYKNVDIEKIMLDKIKKDRFIKNDIVFNNIIKKDNLGFIIVRHVNSEKTNNYWIESYKCIRKYYENKIIIIDDNSDYNFIKSEEGLNIYNCEIMQSEYKSRGELLGYYYFYKNRFFEKAVIIHDSVFINKYIDFDKYNTVKFIWHFTHPWFDESAEYNMINYISHTEELQQYYNKRELIHGCFGVQSVITYKFLYEIETKYNLFNLLNFIETRIERMNLERIFALMCINEEKELIENPSIFGIIHEYTRFGYSYEDYIKDIKNDNLNDKEIIKVWTGR